MSAKGYAEFKNAIENDPGVAERLKAHMEQVGKQNALDELAAFAKSHGFDVKPADVRKAIAEGDTFFGA